jgi:hypothetical protein
MRAYDDGAEFEDIVEPIGAGSHETRLRRTDEKVLAPARQYMR